MKNPLLKPNTNFGAVRDGRNSQVFYVDVALDTVRSVAAGTALSLNVSGNCFYCDANPSDGNAFVRFQDTNFDRAPVPLYVSPGVIFNLPFTQLLLENSAQPGKRIRIAYGIDVDFQPGSVAQIAVTNNGGFTGVRPEAQTGFFSDLSALTANVPITIFTPAANSNGAILLSADMMSYLASGNAIQTFITKSSAPTSVIDGSVLLMNKPGFVNGAGYNYGATLPKEQFIVAGQGLYFISNGSTLADNLDARACRFRLL